MADLEVQVTMSVETVEALLNNGSLLYILKAVRSSSQAGRPLVWRRLDAYSSLTSVTWPDAVQAYTSFSPIQPGQTIEPGFAAAIQAGQILQVTQGGLGTVVQAGPPPPPYVTVENTTQTSFTCGLECAAAPYCAFPLYGLNTQSFGLSQKVLLMFSTDSFAPGAVIDGSLISSMSSPTILMAAVSPGVLIDLGSSPGAEVSFDLNQGWTWATGVQARQVSATANLTDLLIEPD